MQTIFIWSLGDKQTSRIGITGECEIHKTLAALKKRKKSRLKRTTYIKNGKINLC